MPLRCGPRTPRPSRDSEGPRGRRRRCATRTTCSSLLQNAVDGGADGVPAGDFSGELFFAGGGELVETSAAAGIFGGPFSADPAGLFHAVKGGIERAELGVEDVAGGVLDGGHDGIAVG